MLNYLILGFLLATLGCTLINELCEIISVLFEWAKTAVALKIVKHNITIEDLQAKSETTETRAIGFGASWEEDDYEDDDE